ncbi:sensor histidine kinase [Caldalkalibacillus salinus]|uniref:sensor histidine kinase n=1 Tax=Caldalkalibacillus salinus TaxID=2803787 RepID=UPI001F359767|nr:sensor histidine kinase [Caldalkalibacillus salinus]
MAIEVASLDGVIERALNTMEETKYQVFDIAEQARQEMINLEREIKKVKGEVEDVIEKNDVLEAQFLSARKKLSQVSRNFTVYTEEDIRQAYERANTIQVERILLQEKEKQLREKRDDLQLRLRNIEQTVERAEGVLTQFGVVVEYLSGNMAEMKQMIEDAHQNQQLGFKVIQAQEEERKRLAREIHDGPAQSMAHLVLRMDLVDKVLSTGDELRAKEELQSLKQSARESLADVRRIIFDLRPMALDDLGLVPTLKKYIERIQQKVDVKIKFKTKGKEIHSSSSLDVAVFRLIQESLNNIIKHAQATKATVNLSFSSDHVQVVIEDNGVGFDQDNQSQSESEGFGLMGMKERVKLLEGDFQVYSEPSKGTKVIIMLPADEDQNEEGVNDGESNQTSQYTAH